MRILFLTLKTFSATGGIEKFNRCFSKALVENGAAAGWEVMVYSAYDQEPDEAYVPAAQFRGFGGRRRKFFAASLQAMRSADRVIYAHINLAPLALLASKLFPSRQRILLTHGREVWEPLGTIQQRALTTWTGTWSVSDYTAGILVRDKQVPREKIRIFPNCLDPFFAEQGITISRRQLRQRYGLAVDDRVIITVARLANTEQFKGYDILLRLMPELTRMEPKAKYLLCGKWDPAERDRINGIIAENRLQKTVVLAGFIEDFELPAHYAMADLFVLPSKKEGFGIVFLEAAWCGLPVIGGNRDGSVEALLHGLLGTLVDPDDKPALLSVIFEAISQPFTPEKQQMQRDLVTTEFGFQRFKQRQLDLLRQQSKPAARQSN